MSQRWDVSTSLWVSVMISETDLLTELLRCSSLLEVPLSKDDRGTTLTAVESVEEPSIRKVRSSVQCTNSGAHTCSAETFLGLPQSPPLSGRQGAILTIKIKPHITADCKKKSKTCLS